MRKLSLVMMLALTAPATAQDVGQGSAIYDFYCATCHGVSAMGNGPMSPSLVVAPPDLTALAARNDGVFPRSAW